MFYNMNYVRVTLTYKIYDTDRKSWAHILQVWLDEVFSLKLNFRSDIVWLVP